MTDNMDYRAVAPKIYPFPPVTMPQLRVISLDNGIPMYVLDQKCSDVCRIALVRDGGTAEAVRPTVATLMSEMLCEGTKSLNGPELTDKLEFNGAWFNGISHRHHTSAVMYALNSTFNDVLPLLYSMTTEADFPEDRFLVLRNKAAGNASVRARQVKSRSLEAIRSMVYGPNHHYARIDTPEEIASIMATDVKQYYGNGIADSSMAIYIGGRITPSMEDMVNNRFGQMMIPESGVQIERLPMRPVADRIATINVSGAMQGAVKIAIPTIGPSHPDYCDLALAVVALGGYFGSRLMSNIREDKGYTYGIQAFMTGAGNEGMMVVSSEADNAYVVPLIVETLSEIKKLSEIKTDGEELERMRNYVISQAVATLDSPFNILNYYESLRYDNLPDNAFQQRMAAVAGITGERIIEMSSKYLREENVKIAVAGDIEQFPVDENRIFN